MAAARLDGFRLMSSAAAVYSMAITSSATQRSCASASISEEESRSPQQIAAAESSELAMGKAEAGRFTPKFDGLRFIETLVTAHR